jgi:hypothetical protein
MTYEGGRTDVDDFRGGSIHFAGIKFGHQQQQTYWQAIDRYLDQKIHETFKKWDVDTRSYAVLPRRGSIEGVERNLRHFVAKTMAHAVETDRSLRGAGYPKSVEPYVPTIGNVKANTQISNLAAAHRVLLDELNPAATPPTVRTSLKQRVEDYLSSHKGIMGAIGLLIGALGLARYFFR